MYIIVEYHFLAFQERWYAECLKTKCREIVESKVEDGQCGFCPRHRTTDQIFTLRQIFEKFWEYATDVFACFVDLEKNMTGFREINSKECCRSMALTGIYWWASIDGHLLMGIYWWASIDGHLLMAIESIYWQPKVFVRVNSKQSK